MLPPLPPIAAAAVAALSVVTLPPAVIDRPSLPPVPALELIKTYGTLAGPECYGRASPPGSSCRIPLPYLRQELGLTDPSSSLNSESFARRLSDLDFEWPLKPYGLTEDSLKKTAVMNKGAETATYMSELERRGLYDRRNPAGPLPTSLRPKLNELLKREGIDDVASERTFRALSGGRGEMTAETVEEAYGGKDALDYYSFVELIGKENVEWPRYDR